VPAQVTRRAEKPKGNDGDKMHQLPMELPKVLPRDAVTKDTESPESKPKSPLPMLPRDDSDDDDVVDDADNHGMNEVPQEEEPKPMIPRHFPHVPAPADAVVPQSNEHDEASGQEAEKTEPKDKPLSLPIEKVAFVKEKVY
jgi:hypothetical protein